MRSTPIPPALVPHPAFSLPENAWVKNGAPAVWESKAAGTTMHVMVDVPRDITRGTDPAPEVSVHYHGSREFWYAPLSELRPDPLAALLMLAGGHRFNLDPAGRVMVALSADDRNGLEGIIRLARDDRSAGALDRIAEVAASILHRYRVDESGREPKQITVEGKPVILQGVEEFSVEVGWTGDCRVCHHAQHLGRTCNLAVLHTSAPPTGAPPYYSSCGCTLSSRPTSQVYDEVDVDLVNPATCTHPPAMVEGVAPQISRCLACGTVWP